MQIFSTREARELMKV